MTNPFISHTSLLEAKKYTLAESISEKNDVDAKSDDDDVDDGYNAGNDEDNNYNIYRSTDGTIYRHSTSNGGIEWHANIDGSMERHGGINGKTDQHNGDTNSHYLFKLATNTNGRCSDENQAKKDCNETTYHSGINANEGDVSYYCNPGNYCCYGLKSSLIFPRKCFTLRGRYIYIAPTALQQPHISIKSRVYGRINRQPEEHRFAREKQHLCSDLVFAVPSTEQLTYLPV